MEVAEDHVHLLVDIPPKQSVGGTVRELKSLSARYMFKRFPYLRRVFWTDEMWSPGYFVRSVGDSVLRRWCPATSRHTSRKWNSAPSKRSSSRKPEGRREGHSLDPEAPGRVTVPAEGPPPSRAVLR